jgi:hypothetical protein
MLQICTFVRRGFMRLALAESSEQRLAHLGSEFQKFRESLCRMTIPVIRLWFEGTHLEGKPWRQAFIENVQFKAYKPAQSHWQIDDAEVDVFVEKFLEWVRLSHEAPAFIAALCGVTGLLPIKTLSHRFIVIADSRAANAEKAEAIKPNILLPKQRRVLYVVRDWELFEELPKQIVDGNIQIDAVGKDKFPNHIKIGKVGL